MANNRCTYQQVTNVSINKEALLQIASSDQVTKKDYKVLLVLFCQLNGWCEPITKGTKDPKNFSLIDTKAISKTTGLSKKEVKKCIDNLEEFNIIEKGNSDTIKNGYRFTF